MIHVTIDGPWKSERLSVCHIASIIVLSFKFSASVFFFFLFSPYLEVHLWLQGIFFALSWLSYFSVWRFFNSHESYYIFNTTYFVVTNIHFQISPKIIVYWNKTWISSIKSSIINAFTTSCFGDIQHLHEILQHQIAMGDIPTTSSQSSSKKLQSGVIEMCKKIKVVNDPVILQECKNTHFWVS
jgi:hypothetical protein